MPSSKRRLLIWFVQTAVLATVAYFIARVVSSSWSEIEQSVRISDLRPTWLIAAMVIYGVGLLPAVWFWRHALQRIGERQSWLNLTSAYFVGNLGKYVPGKAMVVVLRVALLRNRTCSVRAAAASVFYETLTMMAVGGFVGGAILAIMFRDQWLYVLAAAGLSLVSLVPTLPPVFAWLSKKLGANGVADEATTSLPKNKGPQSEKPSASHASSEAGDEHAAHLAASHLGTKTLLVGWAANLITWALLGASLWAVCLGLSFTPSEPFDAPLAAWAICTAAASLAMVAGFLSFIPAGALVRESMILAVLSPAFGKADALLAAVACRLIWLSGELLISVALYVTVRSKP